MSEELERRGLTVETVRGDALDVINHFGGRKHAAAALHMSISHLHHLFGTHERCSPELLVKLYGVNGGTLRPELAGTAGATDKAIASIADNDFADDEYGGLTVAELIRSIENDIDETTGMLTTLKALAEGFRHAG